MSGIITDFAQIKRAEEDEKPITRKELREILSGVPVGQLLQQSNALAMQLNNLGFRFNALIEYLVVHGLRKGADTRFRLDGQKWAQFFADAVKKQNQEVEEARRQAQLKAQAANPN